MPNDTYPACTHRADAVVLDVHPGDGTPYTVVVQRRVTVRDILVAIGTGDHLSGGARVLAPALRAWGKQLGKALLSRPPAWELLCTEVAP